MFEAKKYRGSVLQETKKLSERGNVEKVQEIPLKQISQADDIFDIIKEKGVSQ